MEKLAVALIFIGLFLLISSAFDNLEGSNKKNWWKKMLIKFLSSLGFIGIGAIIERFFLK